MLSKILMHYGASEISPLNYSYKGNVEDTGFLFQFFFLGGGGGGLLYISSNCVDSHDNGFDAYIIFYYSILVVCLHLINNEHSRTIKAVVHTK